LTGAAQLRRAERGELRARSTRIASLILLAVLACASLRGDDERWTPFYGLGYDVSVSFARVVDSETYTWKFRNDGSRAVKSMTFTCSYIDAATHQSKTDNDVLPGTLGPGEVLGGWTAFTANTRVQPTIRITKVERQ